MRVFNLLAWAVVAAVSTATAAAGSCTPSTEGIRNLVRRRLPHHVDRFAFELVNATTTQPRGLRRNDEYTVETGADGTVLVRGNSVSALASGLHRYLSEVAHVDIYWFIGSRLHLAPAELPRLSAPLKGSSVVPWRYHFNTVTFSYTTAFWSWEDWEAQLDWMALRGVNLPLAWVGAEKILVDVFREIGLADDEILSFLSGPAFQAWNRFGNIQGSWGGSALPFAWIDGQFELQKRIVRRMVELGMTPVLPSFTGFVPRAITRVFPDAKVVNGSQWEGFPSIYTNVTFLDPLDPLFTQLQKRFITKQIDAYGNVSSIYTLDQYNENDPFSGDLDYLRNVTYGTWKSLKSADPAAVWLMQGWLFYSNSDFWTDERVEAYLSGVEDDRDMLILDLFSESQPQWQRTNSYYGKPWIWCQLHDYGGNMGLHGQIMNVTVNPIEALAKSSSLVGFGLTMEGQEGNEIVYDLLLDQAWSKTPIDTETYFYNWVTSRYNGGGSSNSSNRSPPKIPHEIYAAWDILRTTVYNNTNLAAGTAVSKSILELSPALTGLTNRTGHHPTTLSYDPSDLVRAWNLMYHAASEKEPSLWADPSFQYDMVDITRQVLANAFIPLYTDLVSTYQSGNASSATVRNRGQKLLDLLSALDSVLLTNEHFLLSSWIRAARSWARPDNTTITAHITKTSNCSRNSRNETATADFYEYNARNQITLWGPTGQISDYASKSWGGLVSSYYLPRWRIFVDYLASTIPSTGTDTAAANGGKGNGKGKKTFNATELDGKLLDFELRWQREKWGEKKEEEDGTVGELREVLGVVYSRWKEVFAY